VLPGRVLDPLHALLGDVAELKRRRHGCRARTPGILRLDEELVVIEGLRGAEGPGHLARALLLVQSLHRTGEVFDSPVG
jgi:hypothetical protein